MKVRMVRWRPTGYAAYLSYAAITSAKCVTLEEQRHGAEAFRVLRPLARELDPEFVAVQKLNPLHDEFDAALLRFESWGHRADSAPEVLLTPGCFAWLEARLESMPEGVYYAAARLRGVESIDAAAEEDVEVK